MSAHNTTRARQADGAARPGASQEPVPFLRRVLITVGVVMAVALLLLSVWQAADVLLLVFAGILLAVLLNGMSEIVADRTPFSRGWALIVVLLTLTAVFGVGGWLIAPGLTEQTEQLIASLPPAIEQVQAWIAQFALGRTLLEQAQAPGDFLASPGDILAQATGIFTTTIGALINIFIILFVALYLAADPGLYKRGIIRLMPIPRRPRTVEVLNAIGTTLWWWLLGRLFSMATVGIMTGVGLWLLGVPLAFTLGLLAALLDFIPNIGPFLAAGPGILIALMQGPDQAIYVTILYIVVQQIESYLITPIVQQRAVKLPPVVTIAAQVLLGIFFGGLGLILASPLAAVVLVLVKMLYVQDMLGDEVETLDSEDEKPEIKLPELPGTEREHSRQEA